MRARSAEEKYASILTQGRVIEILQYIADNPGCTNTAIINHLNKTQYIKQSNVSLLTRLLEETGYIRKVKVQRYVFHYVRWDAIERKLAAIEELAKLF